MHYASKGKRREGHVVDVEQRAYHISHFSSASISDSERERERESQREMMKLCTCKVRT